MIRKLAIGLSLVLMAVLAVAPAATAQDKVEGTMDPYWNECFSGPGEEIPDWIGTIDVDGDVYDMLFFNVGNGRPPNHPPAEGVAAFNEVWAIYDGLQLAFDEACAVETFDGDLVLWGLDHGTADLGAMTYEMTGPVMEALGAFDGLAGETVSMSGTIVVNEDAPDQAPGIFQIG